MCTDVVMLMSNTRLRIRIVNCSAEKDKGKVYFQAQKTLDATKAMDRTQNWSMKDVDEY